ncbi:hypothetical protein D3C85_1859140 [compost metagenome]
MLFYDVNNGIARRAWAQNDTARQAIEVELKRTTTLKVTLANLVDTDTMNQIFKDYEN